MRSSLTYTRVRLFCLVGVVLALLGEPTLANAGQQDVQQLKKEGDRLLDRADFRGAANVFREMFAECRGDDFCKGVALIPLARANMGLGKYDEAREALEEADAIFARLGRKAERGVVFHLRGRVAAAKTEYTQALQDYASAERFLSGPGTELEVALLNSNRAAVNIAMRNYEDAAKNIKKARALLGGKQAPGLLANLDAHEGRIHIEKQRWEEAKKSCEKALAYYNSRGASKDMALQFNQLGMICEARGEYADALRLYEEALKLAQQASHPSTEAYAWNSLGSVHWKRGNYTRSLNAYSKALEIRRKLAIKHLEANTLNNIGLIYLARGNYDDALKAFRDSAGPSGSDENRFFRGWALHNMALVFKEQGKFPEAHAKSQEAIKLSEEIEDRKLEATAILRLGNLYEYLGLFDDAEKEYEKAATIQKKVEDWLFLSNTYSDLGNILTRKGNLTKAEGRFKEGLDIRKKKGMPLGEFLCNFSLFYMEKDRYGLRSSTGQTNRKQDLERAAGLIKEAEQKINADEKRDFMLLTYTKGRYSLENDPAKAAGLFGDLKSQAATSGSLKYSFLASVGAGLAYEKLEKWPEAETAYENAVKEAEDIRQTLDQQSKRTFLDGEEVLGVKHILPYEGLARVRMRQGKWNASWEAAEYTKARLFAEKIAEKVKGATAAETELLKRLDGAETELASTLRQLQESGGKQGDASAKSALEAQKKRLEETYGNLKGNLKRDFPRLSEVRFPQPIPIEKSALDENEWTLAYEITDTGLLIYLANGQKIVKALFKPTPRQEIVTLVEKFRHPLETQDVKFECAVGKQLADLLLSDVLPDIPNEASLVIIPDEILGTLPFEALVLEDGCRIEGAGEYAKVVAGFFGDRLDVSYQQSGTAMSLSRKLDKSGSSGDKILVMADPVFDSEEAARKHREETLGKLPGKLMSKNKEEGAPMWDPLPLTAELAQDLEKLYPGRTEKYLQRDATKSKLLELKDRLTRYETIVFATHGYAGGDLPGIKEPVLVLTPVGGPDDRGGYLAMSEVMNLRFAAQVAAITACQSGVGPQVSGEGTMGIGRAFQYAGTKSVLMSLWEIQEEASVALTKAFFENLKAGKTKEQALKAARAHIRDNGHDHPYFWAAFILAGEAK